MMGTMQTNNRKTFFLKFLHIGDGLSPQVFRLYASHVSTEIHRKLTGSTADEVSAADAEPSVAAQHSKNAADKNKTI